MPRISVTDGSYLVNSYFRHAKILEIDRATETAKIELLNKDGTGNGEIWENVPFFFHCKPDVEINAAGGLQGGYQAFKTLDIVAVRFDNGQPKILANLTQKRKCQELVFVVYGKYLYNFEIDANQNQVFFRSSYALPDSFFYNVIECHGTQHDLPGKPLSIIKKYVNGSVRLEIYKTEGRDDNTLGELIAYFNASSFYVNGVLHEPDWDVTIADDGTGLYIGAWKYTVISGELYSRIYKIILDEDGNNINTLSSPYLPHTWLKRFFGGISKDGVMYSYDADVVPTTLNINRDWGCNGVIEKKVEASLVKYSVSTVDFWGNHTSFEKNLGNSGYWFYKGPDGQIYFNQLDKSLLQSGNCGSSEVTGEIYRQLTEITYGDYQPSEVEQIKSLFNRVFATKDVSDCGPTDCPSASTYSSGSVKITETKDYLLDEKEFFNTDFIMPPFFRFFIYPTSFLFIETTNITRNVSIAYGPETRPAEWCGGWPCGVWPLGCALFKSSSETKVRSIIQNIYVQEELVLELNATKETAKICLNGCGGDPNLEVRRHALARCESCLFLGDSFACEALEEFYNNCDCYCSESLVSEDGGHLIVKAWGAKKGDNELLISQLNTNSPLFLIKVDQTVLDITQDLLDIALNHTQEGEANIFFAGF